MANVDAANGFKVVGHLAGGISARLSRHHIASALASNLARGDSCIPVGTAKNIDRPGSATVRLLGVFDGVFYLDSAGDTQYKPRWASGTTLLSGSTSDAWVYDDPFLLFEAQYNGTLAAGDIGSLGDLTLGTSSALTGNSADEVTNAGSGTNLKIMDLVARPDNALGADAKVIVAIALHYHAGAKTTI